MYLMDGQSSNIPAVELFAPKSDWMSKETNTES